MIFADILFWFLVVAGAVVALNAHWLAAVALFRTGARALDLRDAAGGGESSVSSFSSRCSASSPCSLALAPWVKLRPGR
jgi:hypothetical protein